MIAKLLGSLINSGDNLAKKGIEAFKRGNYKSAIEYFDQAIDQRLRKYSFASIASLLGFCYQYEHELDKAIEWLNKAIESDREYARAWLSLGILYRRRRDFDEAERCYQEGLNFSPNDPELLANLGRLYISKGNYSQAVEILEKSISINPDHAVSYGNLALAFTHLNRFSDAERELEKAVNFGYGDASSIRHKIKAFREDYEEQQLRPYPNYEELIPRILEKLYPEPDELEKAKNILSKYQNREKYRVHLGILKCSKGNFLEMERLVQLAYYDWRDLLIEAEYPLSSQEHGLKEKNPEKYEELKQKEYDEYGDWIKTVLES